MLVFEILFDYPEARNDLWDLVLHTYRSSKRVYLLHNWVHLMPNTSLIGSFFYYENYETMPHFLEEDVRERAQEMKAFLMAIEAKDANAEEEYQNFKIKTAAATLASNEVRSMD